MIKMKNFTGLFLIGLFLFSLFYCKEDLKNNLQLEPNSKNIIDYLKSAK